MTKMSALADPFNQGTLNGSLWDSSTGGSATLSYASSGATAAFPASTTSSTYAYVYAAATYDLTGSSAALHVTGVPDTANVYAYFQAAAGTSNLEWLVEAGSLYARYTVSGTITTLATLTYSATAHAYWRIRESGGTTYWDTSSNGINWTNQASASDPITETTLDAVFGIGASANASSPAPFKWNSFNTGQPGSVQPQSTVAISRRSAARAYYANVTGPGNAHAPAGVVQPRATVSVPRRRPFRAVWASVKSTAFPNGSVQPRATVPVPRRASARAVIRGTAVAPLIAAAVTGGHAYRHAVTPHRAVIAHVTGAARAVPGISGTAQPRATLPAPRRQGVRAVTRAGAVPPAIGLPVTGGRVAHHTVTPHRAAWAGIAGPANAHAPAGTVQPRATIPVPRRAAARAVWNRVAGVAAAVTPGVPGTVQPPATAPVRRRPVARAAWQSVAGPANAAPPAPPSGTVQPYPAQPSARRYPSRAVIRGRAVPPSCRCRPRRQRRAASSRQPGNLARRSRDDRGASRHRRHCLPPPPGAHGHPGAVARPGSRPRPPVPGDRRHRHPSPGSCPRHVDTAVPRRPAARLRGGPGAEAGAAAAPQDRHPRPVAQHNGHGGTPGTRAHRPGPDRRRLPAEVGNRRLAGKLGG